MIIVKKQMFDLMYLEAINDPGLIEEVINLYLEETQLDLLRLEIAMDKSDFEDIHATLDKMKISSGMIQANALYLVLEEIEIISKYGGEYGKLCELGYVARFEFDQLKHELELYLKNIYKQLENEPLLC